MGTVVPEERQDALVRGRSTAGETPGQAVPAAVAANGVTPAPSRRRRLSVRTRKRVAWTAAALALLMLLVYAFQPTPIEVRAVPVVHGPLETTVDAEGVTRVRDRYQVAAPVAGVLQRITLREGDAVPAGAVIARITPLPLDPQAATQVRARLGAAEAGEREAATRVAQSLDAFQQADRTAARMRAVAAAGGVSADALERAELQASTARGEHEAAIARARAAEMEVVAARAALVALSPAGSGGEVVLRAPVAGSVLRVAEPSERVVAAGTPLIDLGDPAALEVVVDVLSTDAVRIGHGATMRIEEWGGNGALTARVRLVEPAGFTKVSTLGVEEQRVNVVGELEGPPAALGHGYRVETRIVTWATEDALKVPTSALFRQGSGWGVFVVEDGRARLRPVEIGHRGRTEAEVLGGLAAGESVILFPSDRLADGARVRTQ